MASVLGKQPFSALRIIDELILEGQAVDSWEIDEVANHPAKI